ncbi:MAG TPA: hypothetical protein VMN57_17165, partial [Anaerolineales bacterium]|nr:hypothetical protein [Anaerolineales bacterium]
MISKRRKTILVLGGTLGLLFALAAIFAFELGFDNNPDWGRGRFALLGSGLLLLTWAAMEPVRPRIRAVLLTLHDRMGRRLEELAMRRWWRDRADRMDPHQRARLLAWTFAAATVFALFAYNWIFTAGRIDDWQSGSRYFHRQAEAFAAGQLHLLEQPGPELLAAENPYFYLDRGEIPVLWDALFYDGKYYLYWGPVPGLIVASLQPLTAERIRDSFLVGAFMAGYLGFAAALLLALRRRFEWFPARILPGALLALALPGPLLWLFTRPNVYEAAIAGGQFFLMGGLFFAFTAFTREPVSGRRLALAGLLWGLAANTRVNLVLAIACAGLLVSLRIWFVASARSQPFRQTATLGLAFGLPLL